MKKLVIIAGLFTMAVLSGCSKSVDLGQLPIVDSSPIVVAEADAELVAIANPIVISSTDCGNGTCVVRAQFMNHGSKQARDMEYSFDASSDAIEGSMTSGYKDILSQGETSTVDFTLYYSGNTMPNEKLGTIGVNYIKNATGERATASLDVVKQ